MSSELAPGGPFCWWRGGFWWEPAIGQQAVARFVLAWNRIQPEAPRSELPAIKQIRRGLRMETVDGIAAKALWTPI